MTSINAYLLNESKIIVFDGMKCAFGENEPISRSWLWLAFQQTVNASACWTRRAIGPCQKLRITYAECHHKIAWLWRHFANADIAASESAHRCVCVQHLYVSPLKWNDKKIAKWKSAHRPFNSRTQPRAYVVRSEIWRIEMIDKTSTAISHSIVFSQYHKAHIVRPMVQCTATVSHSTQHAHIRNVFGVGNRTRYA